MGSIVAFILNNGLLLVILAIAAGMGASSAASKGNIGLARVLAWSAFVATGLMTAAYIAMTVLGAGVSYLAWAALWGFFAWREWKLIRQLRG